MPKTAEAGIGLMESLAAMNKEDLQEIRRALEVPQASQLNKQELARRLHDYMLEHLEEHLARFDPRRFDFLARFTKSPGGSLPVADLLGDPACPELFYYTRYGLLFLDRDRVAMPAEIKERLRQVDVGRLRPTLVRNEEWIKLTLGMLFYYGYMATERLADRIRQYTGQAVPLDEYRRVLADMDAFDFSLNITPNGFSYFKALEPERIEQEHLSRPALDYYSFTREELVRASADDYVDRHPAYRNFVKFLQANWAIDAEDADALAEEVVDRIQLAAMPSDLIEFLQEEFEFASVEQMQGLVDALTMLMNQTRLWDLKGHKPVEVSQAVKEGQAPAGPMGGSAKAAASAEGPAAGEVYNFQTGKKVGRNDPCPCGSGKKFKKCCGAN